jgi:hypothetical protein
MKTDKGDVFLEHVKKQAKNVKFAVVGKGSKWWIFEGTDLKSAAPKTDEDAMFKGSCRMRQKNFNFLVVGGSAETKVLKEKIFHSQLQDTPKAFSFKTINAKEYAECEALLNTLEILVEEVGRASADKRYAVVALFNEANDLAADGTLDAARAKVAELQQRLKPTPVPPPGPPQPASAASQTAQPPVTPAKSKPLPPAPPTRSATQPDADIAPARQKLQELLHTVETALQVVDPEFAARMEAVKKAGQEFSDSTAGEMHAAKINAGYELMRKQFMDVAKLDLAKKNAAKAQPQQPPPQTPRPAPPQPQAAPAVLTQTDVMADLQACMSLPAESQMPFMATLRAVATALSQCPSGDAARIQQLGAQARKLKDDAEAFAAKQQAAATEIRNTLLQVPSALKQPFQDRMEFIAKEMRACFSEANADKQLEMLGFVRKSAADFVEFGQGYLEIQKILPPRKDAFDQRIKELADPVQRKALLAEVKQLTAGGAEKARAAAARVKRATPEELEQLSGAERIAMLTDLRRGGGIYDEECKAALIKAFESMPLENDFRRKDDAMRRQILDNLKASDVLQQARREWDTLPKEKRFEVLQEALKIQCQGMGIPDNELPPIKRFSDPAAQVTEHKKLTCTGYQADGALYINDQSSNFDDFDGILDTVIHENTHNYQHRLVAKLESDPPQLKPGDPDYNQAVLFQMNFGPGYLEGDGADREAYELQPTERHAWLAGGEAHKIFVEDAQAEGQILMTKMTEWYKTCQNPLGSRVMAMRQAVESAVASGSTTTIAKAVRTNQAAFDQLIEEVRKSAATPPSEANPRDPYRARSRPLIDKIKEWVGNHPDQAEQIAAIINGLEDDVEHRAVRLLNKQITMADERFQSIVRNTGS